MASKKQAVRLSTGNADLRGTRNMDLFTPTDNNISNL
jgi:hypothetical protein